MYHIDSAYIPADYSDHSRTALALARLLKPSTLTVSHLLDDWAPHVRAVLFPYAALGEDDVEFEHELIESARAGLRDHLNIGDDDALEVDLDRPPGCLDEQIRSHDPDAVIMGAFGERGPRPGALGSTAERVLAGASCPVILARHFGGPPSVGRVLAGVDLSPNSAEVIAHALGAALQLDAELELVHVFPDPTHADATGALAEHLNVDTEALEDAARGRVEALFEQHVGQIDVNFPKRDQAKALLEHRTMLIGDPALTLIDYAVETDVDLVVVGSRRGEQSRRNLGRVARTTAANCPTHIMVVPAL